MLRTLPAEITHFAWFMLRRGTLRRMLPQQTYTHTVAVLRQAGLRSHAAGLAPRSQRSRSSAEGLTKLRPTCLVAVLFLSSASGVGARLTNHRELRADPFARRLQPSAVMATIPGGRGSHRRD